MSGASLFAIMRTALLQNGLPSAVTALRACIPVWAAILRKGDTQQLHTGSTLEGIILTAGSELTIVMFCLIVGHFSSAAL
jgi:hypothetical protein